MSRIEHVALWVEDLEAMCSFYAHNFGASVGPLYENKTKGFASRFLSLGEGARMELMSSTTLSPSRHEPGVERMGLAHLAVSVGSIEQVNSLTERLRVAGVRVLNGPRKTGDGCYESVVLDPEGNRVEITV